MKYAPKSFFWKMVIFTSLVGGIAGYIGGTYGAFFSLLLLAGYMGSLTALYVDAKEHEEYLDRKMMELENDFDELWDDFIELKVKLDTRF